MSIGRAELPIGTTEAAVRSCVSVIAAVTSQREEVLAYWLDLYYQVRRAYEIEQHVEEDPRLIRREDLYPVLREMMRDALKSTAREKAVEKMAEKKAKDDGGPPRASAPTDKTAADEEAEGDGADESAPPSESGLSGFEPVTPKPRSGWAAKKAAIRERLIAARAEGVTIAQLEATGCVFPREIFGILEAQKVEMKSYRRVEAALDALGR